MASVAKAQEEEVVLPWAAVGVEEEKEAALHGWVSRGWEPEVWAKHCGLSRCGLTPLEFRFAVCLLAQEQT